MTALSKVGDCCAIALLSENFPAFSWGKYSPLLYCISTSAKKVIASENKRNMISFDERTQINKSLTLSHFNSTALQYWVPSIMLFIAVLCMGSLARRKLAIALGIITITQNNRIYPVISIIS